MKYNKFIPNNLFRIIFILVILNATIAIIIGNFYLTPIGSTLIIVLQSLVNIWLIFEIIKLKNSGSFADSQLAYFLINSKTNYLIKLNNKGFIQFTNLAFNQNLSDKNLINTDIQFLIHAEHLLTFNETLNWCLNNPGKVKYQSLKIIDKQGIYKAIDFEFCTTTFKTKAPECILIGSNIGNNNQTSIVSRILDNNDIINTIVRNQNYFFWIYDVETNKRIFSTENCINVYGYSSEELSDNDDLMAQIIAPLDYRKFVQLKELAINTGESSGIFKIIRKNKSLGFVKIRANAYIDPLTNKKYFIGFTNDITTEVESKNELILNSQKNKHLLSTIADPFIAVNKYNEITYANAAFKTEFNFFSDDEVNGVNLFDIEDFKKFNSLKIQLLNAIQLNNKQELTYEFKLKQTWKKIFLYPGDNFCTLIIRDINEQLKKDVQIKEQERILNNILSNNQEMIWAVDKNINLLYFNQKYAQVYQTITGVIPDKNMPVLKYITDTELFKTWFNFYTMALNGQAHIQITTFAYNNEITHYYENFFYPLIENGEIFGVSCFSYDITNRKKQELKIENQNKRFKEIAWMQSHEVRKPLANILGLSSLFNTEDLTDPFNQVIVDNMNSLAHELDGYIRKIVDMASLIENEFEDEDN